MLLPQLLSNLFTNAERIINSRQKRTSLQIDKRELFAIRFDHCVAAAWRAWRKISRTDKPRLIVDKFKNILIVPSMITHRNAMHTPIEKFIGNG
ncbi:hypothetical protein D3C73_665420 [compost metagenome]